MKIIIPLAGYGKRMRPQTWSRPKPLLQVAGNTIIGHLLNFMSDITTDELIFIVGYKGAEIEAYMAEQYAHLKTRFVYQEELLGQAHALWLCREFMDGGELLVAFGDGVVDAHYSQINQTTADGVCLVQEVADPRNFGVVITDAQNRITGFIEKPKDDTHKSVAAGIYWFRRGDFLREALDQMMREKRQTNGEYYLVDAYQIMLAKGLKIEAQPCLFWLDAGNPENVLATNARLLGMGYGSEDAIDRSYMGDFTVLPPVFLHETAVVEGSVIGPYATIGENVVVRSAIVRNSILETGSHVENCILDGSLVGERAQVIGHSQTTSLGDDAALHF